VGDFTAALPPSPAAPPADPFASDATAETEAPTDFEPLPRQKKPKGRLIAWGKLSRGYIIMLIVGAIFWFVLTPLLLYFIIVGWTSDTKPTRSGPPPVRRTVPSKAPMQD
jgi:hypothetical protein